MTSIMSLEKNGSESHHFLFVCGNTNQKTIQLDPPLKNVIGVEVNSALIPRSEYTIEDGRNVFYYNYNGQDKEIQIENADYNLIELLNTINYSINEESIPIVLYEDEDTKRICASGSGTSFTVYSKGGLNKMLGFHYPTHADFSVNGVSRMNNVTTLPNINSIYSLNRIDNIHYSMSISVEAYYSNSIYTNLLALQFDTTVLEIQQEGYYFNTDFNYSGRMYSSQHSQELLTFPTAIFVENISNDVNLSINPYIYISGKLFLFIVDPWFTNYDWKTDQYSYRDIIKQAITDNGQNAINSYDADNPSVTNYKVLHGTVLLGELTLKQMSLTYGYNDYISDGTQSTNNNNNNNTTTVQDNIAFPSSGPAILCGDRYNLDGTDVILLRSNIDSFINGGKYNNYSSPLAKFYVHNKESQNVQVINYEQPARTFFPISRLSEIEFTFERALLDDDPYKLYEFHHLQWYMQIVVKTIDYTIPKQIPQIENEQEEKHQNMNLQGNVRDKKKYYYMYYALAASIIGFIIIRRLRK